VLEKYGFVIKHDVSCNRFKEFEYFNTLLMAVYTLRQQYYFYDV